MFDRGHFARFLKGSEFDLDKALAAFTAYTKWRKDNQVDVYYDAEFSQYDKIKAFIPNGWFETDVDGNPVFLLNIGQMNIKKLLDCANVETIIKFFFTEIEHTWRMKF
jgi:hypothetical protein